MIVIIFVLCGYIVVCAATKLTGIPDHAQNFASFFLLRYRLTLNNKLANILLC